MTRYIKKVDSGWVMRALWFRRKGGWGLGSQSIILSINICILIEYEYCVVCRGSARAGERERENREEGYHFILLLPTLPALQQPLIRCIDLIITKQIKTLYMKKS